MDFRFSTASIIDLEEIYDYLLLNAGSETADKVTDEIKRIIQEVLAENPGLGTPALETTETILSFPAGKYSVYQIYYQLQGDVLEVYRVLHGKRNTDEILE